MGNNLKDRLRDDKIRKSFYYARMVAGVLLMIVGVGVLCMLFSVLCQTYLEDEEVRDLKIEKLKLEIQNLRKDTPKPYLR